MPPVLAVNLLVYVLMSLGLYRNGEAALLAVSQEWFAGFNSFAPSFLGMLKESLVGCFLWGSNDYNGVLWTMEMLFLGAYLVYGLALLVGGRPWRWFLYGILALVLLRTDYLGLFLGYVLCDFMGTDWEWRRRLCGCSWFCWLCAAAGLYLMSYPSSGFGYEGTLWEPLGRLVLVNYYHILGVLLFVFALLNLRPLQRLFSARVFQYLGRISYSLYLLHFPVTATLGAGFLLWGVPRLGYNLTCLLNLVLVSAVTLLLSELCYRYVEPLGKRIEDWIGGCFGKKA